MFYFIHVLTHVSEDSVYSVEAQKEAQLCGKST